ncbi:hypothetical protein CGRA01v4_08226 [Colletotrichum graminicola]|uniref:Mid2 domain-containing protein n=1 Tax=Colletotrichum graminicola (strain M1.001 / M2 / FGSC 10212) TaxID=645133 RepID=E3QV13_COLGM|nr:uncharacterized protein GLRG_09847 [Colletotrichum graminicola M1.001]EFQ34703.1 hypothetical protein GLRG_09847 [Colletotrichum graminicola M1.001]WDK16943.1 hypothetical protein CGRA01v4_08226 [Colletotrichum graminicola]
MLLSDGFMRLPPTTAVLLLSSIFALTEAGALPPQTQAQIALRTLDVRSWPLATPAPWLGMMRRQDDSTNTVCGYISGDPNLPATCSAGSHCAMDASASAVGCCPNGVACSTGIYTSCVDGNSPTQTASDPYIFTCQGSNVCYRNTYDGGAYQYGCGTSSQGATVLATASGLSTTVAITRVSVITREETSSSSLSTSSSSSSTSSSTTSTTASSSSSTSSSSSSSTTSTSASSTTQSASATEAQSSPSGAAGPPPGAAEAANRRHSATIGGAIGGAAVLVAIISVALWMCKRNRRRNRRLGPGAGKGPSFVPEPNSKEFSAVPGGEMMFDQAGYGHPAMMPGAHGTTTSISGGKAAGTPPHAGPGGYNPAHGASHSTGEGVPLTQSTENEDFTRGYNDAPLPVREEYRPTSSGSSTAAGNPYSSGSGTDSAQQQAEGADGKPLWQQNRRQSRNMVWR